MPHETDRPCLICSVRHVLTRFHVLHGYTPQELIFDLTIALSDLVVNSAMPGHELEAQTAVRDMLAVELKEAFRRAAQRAAEQAAGPKEPTTSDIGHA